MAAHRGFEPIPRRWRKQQQQQQQEQEQGGILLVFVVFVSPQKGRILRRVARKEASKQQRGRGGG